MRSPAPDARLAGSQHVCKGSFGVAPVNLNCVSHPIRRARLRLDKHASKQTLRVGSAVGDTDASPQSIVGVQGQARTKNADVRSGGFEVCSDASFLRKAAGAVSTNELLDLLFEEFAKQSRAAKLSDQDCRNIILASLERGNPNLAVEIFEAMKKQTVSITPTANTTATGWSWPASSLETTSTLVVGLTRCLCVKEAVKVIGDLRSRGIPQTEEVLFGHVVRSPLAADNVPLAVVQPQEGQKTVACATTRYVYELFTGTVVTQSSEATLGNQSVVLQFARALGLWKKSSTGAIHELLVQTPAGNSRTFRFGTTTADVPAKLGDKVTIVCCPTSMVPQRGGLFRPTPPGYKPGEPILVSNHTTKQETSTLRPPSGAGEQLPGWIVPAAIMFAGGDAASGLIDPAFPYIAAAGLATVIASGVVGTTVVFPKLKQLPERSVATEYMRQKLLAQHTSLFRKVEELVRGATEDVTLLARLWQLQNKMGTVGGETAYGMRSEKVLKACAGLEERLQKRLELIDGYAQVMNMIEIEVELDFQVPDQEMMGIEEQIQRLTEVEELQEQWQLQAEAQEEVERLLRAI